MLLFQGGLTLPNISAYGHTTRPVAINVFAAVAALLAREASVAESGSAYLTGGLMHAGSVALREAAMRLQETAPPCEETEWIPNTLKVLSDLGMRFTKHRDAFESYAAALRSLTVVPKLSVPRGARHISLYHDARPAWDVCRRNRGEPRRDPEPVNFDGDLIISKNDLALLQGLYDRPDCTVANCDDWLHAAYVHRVVLRGDWTMPTLRRAISKVHPAWVIRRKIGTRIQTTLSARGRAIVELEVRVRVRGYRGIYTGMRRIW